MQNLLPDYIVKQINKNIYNGNLVAFSLFSDISGFTATTEELMKHGEEGAEVLSDILKHLFDTSVQAVYEHGGFITRYAGDAFTALFEITENNAQIAGRVLQTALEINNFFKENKVYHCKFGNFEFGVKIGLAYGECQWGITGIPTEKTYYFRGDAIDLCAQAEHNAAKGDIWMTDEFFSKIALFNPKCESLENYGRKFYKLLNLQNLPANKTSYSPVKAEKKIIQLLAGKKESEFGAGEFRKIVSLFISFEGNASIDKIMEIVYRLRSIYGGSHPALDYGDKGGTILIFFGAPTAYENDDIRSLNFILDLQKETLNFLKLRAGLCKGIVYCGYNGAELHREFTCLGNTVNQSARFMMKAAWGEIWTDSDLTHTGGFEFKSLGSFFFKGREDQIPAFAFQGKITGLTIAFLGEFCGRKAELLKIKQYLAPLNKNKNAGVIYNDGEAGSGKSRVMYQVKRSFPIETNQWCYLSCDDIIKSAFNPLTGYIKKLCNISDENDCAANTINFDKKAVEICKQPNDENIIRQFKVYSDYIKNLLGLSTANADILTMEAEEKYKNTLIAFSVFFRALKSNRNLVLAFDNAQHLDQDSLNFLKLFLPETAKFGFALILNCRYKDNGERFDFNLPSLQVKRISLQNFNENQLKELIRDRLDIKKVPVKTVKKIMGKSHGNPLFAEQIIHYLKDNKLFDKKFNIIGTQDIPSGINQLVISRIDKLKRYLRELVKIASVFGHQFSGAILNRMLNDKFKNLSLLLKEGESEDIWQAVSEVNYLFKHAIVRDVVYDMQLKKTIKDLHLLSAQTIEDVYKDKLSQFYGDLAYHYNKAEDVDKAMEYLHLAGYQAKDNFQNLKAVEYFDRWSWYAEQKLGVVDGNWLDFKLSEENKASVREYVEINFERFYYHGLFFFNNIVGNKIIENIMFLSEKINEKKLLVQAYANYGIYFANLGRNDEAVIFFEKTIPIYQEYNDYEGLARVYYNIGKQNWTTGLFEKALIYFEKTLNFVDKIHIKKNKLLLEAKVYGIIGVTYTDMGNLEKALFYYQKQLKINEELNYQLEIALVVGNIGIIHHLKQEYDNAKVCYEKKLKICQEQGNQKEIALTLNNLGFLHKDLNNLKKAILYYRQSYSISKELGDISNIPNTLCNLACAYKLSKHYKEAETNFNEGLLIANQIGAPYTITEIYLEKADMYLSINDRENTVKFATEGLSKANEYGFSEFIEKANEIINKLN